MYRLLLIVCLLSLTSSWADAPPKYDVLIAGDARSQGAVLKELRQLLEKARADAGLTSSDMPVDEFDTNLPEHAAALRRIGLSALPMPLIAATRLRADGRTPEKLLAVVAPASEPGDAVQKLLSAKAFPFNLEARLQEAVGTWKSSTGSTINITLADHNRLNIVATSPSGQQLKFVGVWIEPGRKFQFVKGSGVVSVITLQTRNAALSTDGTNTFTWTRVTDK